MKLKLIITSALLMAVTAVGCTENGDDTPKVTVTLDKNEVEMYEGGTIRLEAALSDGATDTVAWLSSDSAVAAVSDSGLVTAVAAGEATVTASLGKSSAQCLVIVKKVVPVERIIMPTAFDAIMGKTMELEYTVLPYDTTEEQLVWTSSNEAVATVTDGHITGLELGETTVRASSGDVWAECLVTVIDVPVERIELSALTLDLGRGGSEQLTATVWPEEARYLDVTWSTNDSYVATVDQGGMVNGIAHGPAVITVMVGGVTADCVVMVTAVPNVGDYLYSDNTWSPIPNPNKEIVGIVFWVGDPSADDPLLAGEHPGCVNGLAVALDESNAAWQPENRRHAVTVTSWIEANTDLPGVQTDENGSSNVMLQKFIGYGTTKSLEAFDSAPENSTWRIEIVQRLASYRERHQAAENSSGWYIPSIKELKMLCTGESGGRPDWSPITNRMIINSKLSEIGANQLESYVYYSTLETDFESALLVGFDHGGTLAGLKVTSRIVRFVLAF